MRSPKCRSGCGAAASRPVSSSASRSAADGRSRPASCCVDLQGADREPCVDDVSSRSSPCRPHAPVCRPRARTARTRPHEECLPPMIGGRRPLSGRKPGDRRIRVDRPHSAYFRYTGPGQLTAKAAASAPTTGLGRLRARIKGVAIGRPLASEEEIGERLSKKKALAIFSSDAISSSAYATEEIVLAFVLTGSALYALDFAIPIAIAIAGLLSIVAFSYRQVCIAYPTGGGSYSVSKANLGRVASLVAASALLIDYNLTAAVSTSSAVEQIVSAFPSLNPLAVPIGLTALTLITIANLRGIREAGNIFAVPTYLFLFSALVMIAIGVYRIVVLGEHGTPPPEVVHATATTAGSVGIVILLRAFASGAVALTGTEAIATGVPAFQPPESK